MKLIARVKVNEQVVEVNVDEDYVAASEDNVKQYIAYELYDIFGKTIVDFTVLNTRDVIPIVAQQLQRSRSGLMKNAARETHLPRSIRLIVV